MKNEEKTGQTTEENNSEKETSGNVIVGTLGCKQCPSNQEFRVFTREESEAIVANIGKVFDCPNCKGKWILKRVQMRGVILDEENSEEWRIAPLYVPILDSFGIKGCLTLVDVPIGLIPEEEE